MRGRVRAARRATSSHAATGAVEGREGALPAARLERGQLRVPARCRCASRRRSPRRPARCCSRACASSTSGSGCARAAAARRTRRAQGAQRHAAERRAAADPGSAAAARALLAGAARSSTTARSRITRCCARSRRWSQRGIVEAARDRAPVPPPERGLFRTAQVRAAARMAGQRTRRERPTRATPSCWSPRRSARSPSLLCDALRSARHRRRIARWRRHRRRRARPARRRLRIDDDLGIEFVHVPADPRFAPLWPLAGHGALGRSSCCSGGQRGRGGRRAATALRALRRASARAHAAPPGAAPGRARSRPTSAGERSRSSRSRARCSCCRSRRRSRSNAAARAASRGRPVNATALERVRAARRSR